MTPSLRVPLDVLERILTFAFLPSSSSLSQPASTSDRPPLKTSHILWISKQVRTLALPLYYSSITILNGLPDRLLIELTRIVLPNLDPLLLFLAGSIEDVTSPGNDVLRLKQKWELLLWRKIAAEHFGRKEAGYAELMGMAPGGERDSFWCPSISGQIRDEEWEEYYEERIEELYDEERLPSPDELVEQVHEYRNEALTFFGSHPPRVRIELTLDALIPDVMQELEYIGVVAGHPMVLRPPFDLDPSRKEAVASALEQLKEKLDLALKLSLLFEGFPRSFWDTGMPKGWFRVAEAWSWRQEDGQVVRLTDMLEGVNRRVGSH